MPNTGAVQQWTASVSIFAVAVFLPFDPTEPLEAVTKQYVDRRALEPILVDGISIVGDGITIPLSVALIDGGIF